TSARRQNLTAPRSASSSRRPQSGGMNVHIYTANQSYRYAQINYPSPNDYFDEGMISLLYSAFELHKKADLQSDLFTHVSKQLDSAQGAERLYVQLALAYLHWWAAEKDEALAKLGDVVSAAPSDHN